MTPHDHDLQQEQQLLQHFRQHSQGEPSAALDALILDAARQAVSEPAPQPSLGQRLHAWLFGAGSSRTRWSVAFASLATLGIGLSLTWRTQEQLPGTYDMPMAAQAPAPAPVLREIAPAIEVRKQLAEPEKKAEMAESMAGSIEPNASYAAPAPAANMARQMAPAKPQSVPLEALSDSAKVSGEADAAPEEGRAADQPQAATKAKAYTASRAANPAEAQAGNELSEEQLAATLGHSSVDEAPPLELQLHNVLRMREKGLHAEADRLLLALKREYPQQDLDAELKRLQAEALAKPASSP